MPVRCNIITCPAWGAIQPKARIEVIRASAGIIFHHTDGHHPELENPRNESREEAIRFARDIQRFHMFTRGWNDSGHNFLVCRNGMVLQGRWKTVSAIQARKMVVSAHCPDFNGWVGIEHEHLGLEKMTSVQWEASARLQAWIAYKYGLNKVLPVDPHSDHFATECPANLKAEIPRIRARAQKILNA